MVGVCKVRCKSKGLPDADPPKHTPPEIHGLCDPGMPWRFRRRRELLRELLTYFADIGGPVLAYIIWQMSLVARILLLNLRCTYALSKAPMDIWVGNSNHFR